MTIEELSLLVQPEIRNYISEHLDENPEGFALKNSSKKDLPYRAISEQIFCYKKAKIKLSYLSGFNLLYERTALEQCSSEPTAKFKSELINGSRIIDLTGGLGIDSIYFSNKFKDVFYCEEIPLLKEIFLYNIRQLNKNNISVTGGDGIDIIKSFPDNYFDWIYIDPSRRISDRRTVGLQNCAPNVLESLDMLFTKSNNLMIKASPAIEVEEVQKQIKTIKDIYVVSLDNECKEVLIILSKDAYEMNNISSVMISTQDNQCQFLTGNIDSKFERRISDNILRYFYEPDCAIIKARLTPKLLNSYDLFYLNNSVDYLVSDSYISSFPGRIFKVIDFTFYNKSKFKEFLSNNNIKKANIARRDFPDSPETLKKKYSIKDGGNDFLFFTKDHQNKLITVLCRKIDTTN